MTGRCLAWRRSATLLAAIVGVIACGMVCGTVAAPAKGQVKHRGHPKHRVHAKHRVKSTCAKHFPRLIADGFPEPAMRFSHKRLLETTLRESPATISVGANSYAGMEYEGSLPGPTLVICPGDRVVVHLINGLSQPSNLHVHGLHVSPQGAGDNVFVQIDPGHAYTYDYRVPRDQPAGAFWYHPHLHPLVNNQISAGLVGAIVVEGGLDNVLPKVPQRLIVIQGGKEAPTGLGNVLPGAPSIPGPVELLVNGAQNPQLQIRPGAVQRWRIFNATSERMLRIAMPGVTFEVLARDGNTLASMQPAQQLLLGPGSRVEVLVRGGPPGSYPLVALPFHQCFSGCLDPFAGTLPGGTTSAEQDLLTAVSSGPAANDRLPGGPLAHPVDLRQSKVDVNRKIVFARVPGLTGPPTFPLSGQLFDHNRVDVTMKLGSVEEWTLTNPITGNGDEWHTFHIHQNPFQVISVNGVPRTYVDWQDNVNLGPGDTIVIRMRPTDFTGKFVFHCHLTFHEDNGMMGVVQVLADPTPGQVNLDRVVYMRPPPNYQSTLYASTALKLSGADAFALYCRHLLAAAGLA